MSSGPANSKHEAERNSSTSRSLLEDLRDHQSEAWKRMVLLYTPLVHFWCRQLHVPAQDAPDLTQDVFQTVAKSIHTFSKTKPSDTFRGWLKTITRSRVIDWRRRSHGKPTAVGGSTIQEFFAQRPLENESTDDSDENTSVEENQLTQQMYAQALAIIQDRFREKTWKAFWRVVVDGLSPKEVAEELSMEPGAVRVAKSRVLHRLRTELGDLIELDS